MQSALAHAIDQLPPALRSELLAWHQQHSLAVLPAELMQRLQQVSGLELPQLTLTLLPLAAAFSYATISHFHVGAIVWGGSGNFYLGANMEFSRQSLSQTIHAEQCAINHAWLHNETSLLGITINATPCGHCRQFMNETSSAQTLRIYLPTSEHSLPQLLPAAFGPRDLGVLDGLLHPQQHPLPHQLPDAFGRGDLGVLDGLLQPQQHPLPHQFTDRLLLAAAEAATQSYAPYSHSYAGVALQTQDGTLFCGRYAENAAFNPSLPPLQSALIMLRMAGYGPEDIQVAALVESQQGQISHLAATQALLAAYGVQQFRYQPI